MSGDTALLTLTEFNDLSIEDKKVYLKRRFEDAKKLGINLIDNANLTIANIRSITSVKKDDVLTGIYLKNFDQNGDFLKKPKKQIQDETSEQGGSKDETSEQGGEPSTPRVTEEIRQKFLEKGKEIKEKLQTATTVELSNESIMKLAEAIRGNTISSKIPNPEDYEDEDSYYLALEQAGLITEPIEEVGLKDIKESMEKQTKGMELQSQSLDEQLTGLNEAIQTNSVSYYMQPFRNKSKEEIVNEFKKIGNTYMQNMNDDTKEDLLRRLDFEKAIQAQAKALSDYKLNNPPYIERDFTRAGFDLFYKVGDTSYNGTPLSKEYKFIQKEIPKISIRFDPKTGFYKCKQGEDVYIAKNFSVADKWSLKGGFYEYELSKLREMKIKMESLNYKTAPIFKARKL